MFAFFSFTGGVHAAPARREKPPFVRSPRYTLAIPTPLVRYALDSPLLRPAGYCVKKIKLLLRAALTAGRSDWVVKAHPESATRLILCRGESVSRKSAIRWIIRYTRPPGPHTPYLEVLAFFAKPYTVRQAAY